MSGSGSPRLLLDQNLAASLVRRLADLYPGSAHVREMGLASADDEAIWSLAAASGYVIVTKDDDFRQRSLLRGAPPYVVWVRLGNCRTACIDEVGRVNRPVVLREPIDAADVALATDDDPRAGCGLARVFVVRTPYRSFGFTFPRNSGKPMQKNNVP